jgi:tetratricopeptide (TPR) repeat protein
MEVQQKSEYDYNSIVEDLQRQNRLHEAIAFSKRCIQFNPKFPDFYSRLGMSYMELKKWDSAIVNCKKATVFNLKKRRLIFSSRSNYEAVF